MRASFYFTHCIDSGAAPAVLSSTQICRGWSGFCRVQTRHLRSRDNSLPLWSCRATLLLKGRLESHMLLLQYMRPMELTGRAESSNERCRAVSDACAGAKFDFISYMQDSMEDDYGRLVGLGLPMWLFLIFFVLLSSVWGALPQKQWLLLLTCSNRTAHAIAVAFTHLTRLLLPGGLTHGEALPTRPADQSPSCAAGSPITSSVTVLPADAPDCRQQWRALQLLC